MNIKKASLLIFWLFFMISSECIYRMTLFKNIIDSDFVRMIIFVLPISVFLYLVSTLFTKKINKVITTILVVGIYIIFFAQMVYYQVYNNVFSVYSMTNGGQVFEFWRTILSTIVSSLYNYICLTVPLVIYIVCSIKLFDFSPNKFKVKLTNIGVGLGLAAICFVLLIFDKKPIYGSYNLFFNTHAPILSAKKFGLVTTMNLDLERAVFGLKAKDLEIVIDDSKKTKKEIEYNTLDINFDKLMEDETDDRINSLHKYFSSLTGTEKNDYTGMFAGKNVVFFLAESFDPTVVSEEITPTLYKLTNNGFDFTNYYSPLYPASTADGEFRTEWSLISSRGDTLTLSAAKDVYSPFVFANSFSDYDIHIFHNYNGDYYNRRLYFKAQGYDNFRACYYGLNLPCDSFHQSDLDMVNQTMDDYINSESPFFAYYITVSGHLIYTRGNAMSYKNWDAVKDLDVSDKMKCYIAANVELDKALESLINKLTETGKLDDTVIVLTTDHYPYGVSAGNLNEVSEFDRNDPFELYHSDLIIWNSAMERVKIDKVGSNPDILPTLLNLFGKNYDSRLIIGQDLLSSSEGLVILANRSWLTDTVKYNSVSGDASYIKDDMDDFSSELGDKITVDETYLDRINNLVDNEFKISDLVLKTNYYKKVFNINE